MKGARMKINNLRILVGLLALLTSAAEAVAQGTIMVRFDPHNTIVSPGSSFTVKVVADIPNPVLGWGLDVGFDSSVLSLESVEVGPAWFAASAADGDNLAGLAFPSPVGGQNTLLAILHLKSNDTTCAGNSSLTASFTANDLSEGFPLPIGDFAGVTFVGGSVNVVSTPSPPPVNGNSCNGIYSGTFNGSMTVSNGQVCRFVSGGVNGNVTVKSGGTLVFCDARISGNVQLQGGGNLILNNASVGNNVQLNGGGTFTIKGGSIGNNLQFHNIPPGAAMNQITGAQIGGNLEFHDNHTPVGIGPLNTIGGNLHIHNNTAPIQVLNNMIRGNLQCGGNTSISGSGNSARSKQGQCSGF
jgi:hypothetical protein